jgi:hypothetical protein
MRKNINKLIAIAIGVSVMSGSIIPALAADATQQTTSAATNVQMVNGKPLLTLDDAIKAAISNSDTLALDEKKISYQDKINDTNEKVDDASESISDDKKDLDEDTRDITINQLKQQREFDEDKLIQKTTAAYNDIVTRQLKIDEAAKNIEIKTKNFNDATLKKNLGILTSTDLTSTQLQIENLQNVQKSNENALKDAQYSFKVLTGKDVTQYSLEQDIKYETFKIDDSVDEYLDNTIDNYLKYSEQLIKLNKNYMNDKDNEISADDVEKAEKAAEDATKPSAPSDTTDLAAYEKYQNDLDDYNKTINSYTGILAARLTYLNSKLGVYENETNLNENKKKLKDQLRTLYTNLLATEDNITTLKKNIELNNKQLSDAKLKYDLGMMTKSDYDTLVVSSKDLELQLRSYVDQHNTLKEEIQKPWIAFS